MNIHTKALIALNAIILHKKYSIKHEIVCSVNRKHVYPHPNDG